MAFIANLVSRLARKHSLLLPLILRIPLTPRTPLFSSSSSSSSSLPSIYSYSTHRPSLQIPHFSSLQHSPNQFVYETSDFEADGYETDGFDESDTALFLKVLLQTRQFSAEGDAMDFLQESGVRPTSHSVYEALWELRNQWELAFVAFNWAEKCGSNSERTWHLMIWILGKHRRFDIAWRLVRVVYRYSLGTRKALIIMMKRYAAADDASKAIRTFQAMEKFKISTDSVIFYTLLRALCKHKIIEEAEELLFLNKELFPLEPESFNIILNGWCNIAVDVIEAKRLWREMSNCCITPDGTSYTHMISCHSKAGNLFDSLRLYDEMKKKGWVPGIVVYNSLIYILTRENCFTEALNLLDKIKETGPQPDVTTYNSIISPLCEAHRLDVASGLLDHMVEMRLNPNIETYHAFAKVESLQGTLKLINRMKEVGCGPNSDTFLLIFCNFIISRQPENALKMWTEMSKHDIVPGPAHYVQMVQGLASFGWLVKAREFYREMKSRGFSDDPKLEKLLKESETSNKNRQEGLDRRRKGDICTPSRKGISRPVKKRDTQRERGLNLKIETKGT